MTTKSSNEKSLFIAYLCWLVGGLFGLHHFYLGRDKHAFITFSTLGGYFTMGMIRDLWRLPEYVKDANDDLDYLDKLHTQIKAYQKPPSSIVRQSGLMMMGNLLAYLVQYAIPEEILPDKLRFVLKLLLVPFASAFGVWLAGNVGRHEGDIIKPLIAAYLASLPSLFFDIQVGSFSTLAAVIVFSKYSKKWRLEKERIKPIHIRIFVMTLCVALYLSLWASWGYYGCVFEDPETEEPIKCRDALPNFLRSPAYGNLSEAIMMLIEHIKYHGFSTIWKEIMQEFDVSGKTTALATLGLDENASPHEILSQYKRLSRENHPDREQDESKKMEKQEKFIRIQEAYRILGSKVQRYKLQREQENELHVKHDEL